MRQVVLISGHICTGKSELARRLEIEFGYFAVSTSDILKEIAKNRDRATDRLALQSLGDELDKDTDHQWLLNEVVREAQKLPDEQPIVVDNVRTWDQLQHFRTDHDFSVIHAHLWAPKRILEQRYKKKNAERPSEVGQSYTEADLIKNEKDIEEFKKDADVRIKSHIQFLSPDSAEGKTVQNVLQKFKIADELYRYKPGDVVKIVRKTTNGTFSMSDHTSAWQKHKVRPTKNAKQPDKTNRDYCIYHPAHNDYTYNDKWIELLVGELNVT